jgi:hypothetical protein
MEFCGLPPIGEKQRRPMERSFVPRVGNAGGRLGRNKVLTVLQVERFKRKWKYGIFDIDAAS